MWTAPKVKLRATLLFAFVCIAGFCETGMAQYNATFFSKQVQATPTIQIRGTAQTQSQATASGVVLNKPTGVVSGDVLYAFIWIYGNPTLAAPSGWTLLTSGMSGSTNELTVFRRVSDGTDGSSYTFSFGGGTQAYSMGALVAYSGVNTSSPEDVSPVLSFGTASTSTVSLAAITTSTAGAHVLAVFFDVAVADTLTVPSGFTTEWTHLDGTNTQATYGYGTTQSVAGSTGTVSTTGWTAGSDPWAGCLLAIKP